MSADRNELHLWPPFRQQFIAALNELNRHLAKNDRPYRAFMSEGFRTRAYQKELWRKGRFTPPIGKQYIVTQRDGYVKRSGHQDSMCGDIAFKVIEVYEFANKVHKIGEVHWSPTLEEWEYWGHCLRAQNLDWGGDWRGWTDKPHGEWPPTDKAAYAEARRWQKDTGLA